MTRAIRRAAAALAGAVACCGLLAAGAGAQQPRLQGQVPLADQQSGRSLQPYTDNVRVIGHEDIRNRGMNGNLGWIDECAYVSAYFGAEHPLAGLAVLDVDRPRRPDLVKIFPGTPGTRESQVEGNEDSRMVVVMPFSAETPFGDPRGPTQLQIYDVPNDCRRPIRAGTYDFGDLVTHEHRIWRDKIYVTVNNEEGPSILVVDAGDRDNPTLLTTWDLSDELGMPESAAHDLDVSEDGTRAYINLHAEGPGGEEMNGTAILDTSDIAAEAPNPTLRRVSPFIRWEPHALTHSAQLVKIRGRKYMIAMDEEFTTESCPWGWTRILDVEDDANPFQISSFRLEVAKRRNCTQTLRDNAMYSSHYLGVDNPNNARLAFFTWYSSGLRVVDISDPYDPEEVGYFNPGATTDTVFRDDEEDRFANNKVDYSYSFVRYHRGNIWFNSVYGGFWVVRFTGRAGP
jgi:hypothetical protein